MCDLWIRSQDKEVLAKTTSIVVEQDNIIDGYNENSDLVINLGKYATKERALEVLDEIQKLLLCDFVIKNADIEKDQIPNPYKNNILIVKNNATIEPLHRDCVVFEMPED